MAHVKLLWVVAILALTGCGPDVTADETPTPYETASPAVDVSAVFSDLQASEGAAPTDVQSFIDDPDVQQIFESVRERQNIASELDALTLFKVTPQQIAEIEELACRTSVEAAIGRLRLVIPEADLRALPALNRVTAQVAAECPVDSAYTDALSNAFFRFLIANSQVIEPVTEPTQAMVHTYKAGCAAIKAGLKQVIVRMLEIPKGASGQYGLSLALGSVLTECPTWLDGEIGDELRELIG